MDIEQKTIYNILLELKKLQKNFILPKEIEDVISKSTSERIKYYYEKLYNENLIKSGGTGKKTGNNIFDDTGYKISEYGLIYIKYYKTKSKILYLKIGIATITLISSLIAAFYPIWYNTYKSTVSKNIFPDTVGKKPMLYKKSPSQSPIKDVPKSHIKANKKSS